MSNLGNTLPQDGFPSQQHAEDWEAGHNDGLANNEPQRRSDPIYMDGYRQGHAESRGAPPRIW
jgi:hypothetical protein